ncbi:hypothetical protein AX16_005857 [Volvariella volvacea WC 439]|nr:hypothetical protein AX16_005857 [Volvariella volvacea WC 439]
MPPAADAPPIPNSATNNRQESVRALRDGIDSKLQALSKEANRIEQEARHLRYCRNKLAPISTLPVELLNRIIRYSVRGGGRERSPLVYSDRTTYGETFKDVYKQHVVVSAVCTNWRTIILNDHNLWTDIREPYLTLAPTLLERSGTAPLLFHLSQLTNCDKETLKMALNLVSENMQRVKYLALDLQKAQENHALSFIWTPAPFLLECHLLGGDIGPHPSKSLFSSLAPQLTVLELCRVTFSWDLPLLHSISMIQKLTIAYPKNKPTVAQFLQILSSAPSLQELDLQEALPPPGVPNLSDSAIVLPLPPQLTLEDTTAECASFLSHTSAHNVSCFRLVFTDVLLEDSYLVLQPWLSSLWRDTDFALKRLEISGDFPFICCITGDLRSPESQRDRLFILEWQLEESDDVPPAFVPWLLSHLKLSQCTEFRGYVHTPEEWELCINRMPDLESFELTPLLGSLVGLPRSIVEALTIVGDEASLGRMTSPPAIVVPFPRLKSLCVNALCDEEQWHTLLDLLRKRKEKGYGLQKYRTGLFSSHIPREEARAAAEQVVDRFEFIS